MTTSNLANVYAKLLREYGEKYTITYNAPPTYLNNIVGSVETGSKIVLFYKEDRSKMPKSQKSLMSPTKLNVKKDKGDLNLTGSPLKDDCIVDAIADMSIDLKIENTNPWKADEEWHRGICVNKARAIICTQKFQLSAEQFGSVWFVCSGADKEKTLFLQYEFDSKYFSRGIVYFTGVVPTYTVNSQQLIKRHLILISGSPTVATYIENTYNMKPNMSLSCSWSVVKPLPQLIELHACDVMLNQTFRIGDCGPLTEDFINQLRILLYIREDIMAYHEAERLGNTHEVVYRCGRGIDLDELRESINKLLTESSGFSEIDGGSSTDFDIEDVMQRSKLRRLTDLTDKLWEVLKCCSNYKDLKMAFNILFQCAARRNVLNPPTNKNHLAGIITELANRRLAIPCLSGAEPLELLLEIGLEKLYKDYEYIFTESKICSASSLKNTQDTVSSDTKENNFVQPKVRKSLHNAMRTDNENTRKTLLHHNVKSSVQSPEDSIMDFRNSSFDERESAMQIAKLLQIHCTLEHLLIIHINLNLSSVYRDVCAELLKRPLRIVDAIEDDMCDTMNIQLPVSHVRDHLDGKEPNARRIIMKSSNKFRKVKSTFYFSTDNVCPTDLSECFQCDEKIMVKENTYYSWHYQKIKTVKPGA